MFWGRILIPLNYYLVLYPYYLIPWGERTHSEKTPCWCAGEEFQLTMRPARRFDCRLREPASVARPGPRPTTPIGDRGSRPTRSWPCAELLKVACRGSFQGVFSPRYVLGSRGTKLGSNLGGVIFSPKTSQTEPKYAKKLSFLITLLAHFGSR